MLIPIEEHWRIQGRAPPLRVQIFIQFSAKNMQHSRLAHPLWELVPPPKILEPPLRKPPLYHKYLKNYVNFKTDFASDNISYLNNAAKRLKLTDNIVFYKHDIKYTVFYLAEENEDQIQEPIQWQIQDFSEGRRQLAKVGMLTYYFAENCMKMKEFGPPGSGGASLAPPLDPPLQSINEHIVNGKYEYSYETSKIRLISSKQARWTKLIYTEYGTARIG